MCRPFYWPTSLSVVAGTRSSVCLQLVTVAPPGPVTSGLTRPPFTRTYIEFRCKGLSAPFHSISFRLGYIGFCLYSFGFYYPQGNPTADLFNDLSRGPISILNRFISTEKSLDRTTFFEAHTFVYLFNSILFQTLLLYLLLLLYHMNI